MSFWREMLGIPPKQEPIARRSVYHAANLGRLFADFGGTDGSADADLRADLKTMRNRSRALARDDVYVKRFFELLKTNVVGEVGFAHQVKARNANGTMDTGGNAIIERAWRMHGRVGNCTPDGLMSRHDLESYCIEAVARDGEAFFQIVKGKQYLHGIALHPFEADLVDETLNKKLPNGNTVRMGVEVDEYHRPVAYHVKERHPGDNEFSTTTRYRTRRIPAEQVIHVYKRLRAGQTRGEPWLAVAMSQLKMLNAHREAELTAARAAASKMGFFESQTGDEYSADAVDADGTLISDFEAGTFQQLPAGVTFKPFDPSHPGSAFADFQKSILHGIAVGLGPSYASLSGDMADTSYSSVRQGALDERDFYKMVQTFIREHFHERYYAIWLMHVMEFGIIPIPATRFEKFYDETVFRPRGWSWVDPQKEIMALIKGMENGIISPSAASAQYGKDFEETAAEWARDNETATEHGLELAFSPFGPQRQVAAPEQEEQPAPPPPARAEIIVPPPDVTVNVTRDPAPVGRRARIIRDGDGNIVGLESMEDTE